MRLSVARAMANALCLDMEPFCARTPEVLGSIRREKREVKDIEILAVPSWEEETNAADLFGEPKYVNRLHEWATRQHRDHTRWIKSGTSEIVDWRPKADGKYWRGLLLPQGIKLDLFLANATNYGAVQLIRTGSAEFSRAVMQFANERTEYRFQDGGIWRGEEYVPVADEAAVFEMLGLGFVAPWDRVDEGAVRVKKGGK